MKNFVFFKILYPLFKKQFYQLLNDYRFAQVCAIDLDSAGQTWVRINKSYEKGSVIQFFKLGSDIWNPEFPHDEYLGTIEEIFATGTVTEVYRDRSKVLLHHQKAQVFLGLLAKCISGSECIY